jgi:hypothetical protein
MDVLALATEINDRGWKNCKISYYPTYCKQTVASRAVYKDTDDETPRLKEYTPKPQNPNREPSQKSIRRAKSRIFDIAIMNVWFFFVTLTLNGAVIDRENPKIIAHTLKIWLSNKVQRNRLTYLLIPEFHKDGKGIHIHGLVNDALRLTDSGKRTSDGKVIYNIHDWTYGFSTCIPLTGDVEHVAKYITKYISKDFRKIFGNFYYSGGSLKRKPDYQYVNYDYSALDVQEFFVSEIATSFKFNEFREVVRQ